MQIRSPPRWLRIVSIAIAVLPVPRSPMISSRWPRPIAVIESIALIPVSIGSFTGWRCTTPGALNSAGRYSSVLTSPSPSSGWPSGSTIRPSSCSPTGIWSSRSVRLTVSPSSILSHSPKSTAPTLSASRFSASPVTSCGSSSISIDIALSRPWTRAMPSAIERTVPTSDRSAPCSSSPSIRLLRMLVISSGLIFIRRSLSLSSGRSHLSSQFLKAAPDRPVHDHVPDLDCEPADHVGIDDGRVLDAPARLLLDPLADLLDGLVVELDGTGDRNRAELVLLGPDAFEGAANPEQDGHPVALRDQLH